MHYPFTIDDNSEDRIHGFNANLFEGTATKNANGSWSVRTRSLASSIYNGTDFADRDAAFGFLCTQLGRLA